MQTPQGWWCPAVLPRLLLVISTVEVSMLTCVHGTFLTQSLFDSGFYYLAQFPFCFVVCQPTRSFHFSLRINSLLYPLSRGTIIHKANKGMIAQTELVAMQPHYWDNNTSNIYISAVSYTTELNYALFGLNQVILGNLVWSLFKLGMRTFFS